MYGEYKTYRSRVESVRRALKSLCRRGYIEKEVYKARFSEVCGAADDELATFTAADGDGACAQLSRAIDTGEAQWDRRHAAWWLA
jgi:hypothetical protein